MISSRLKLSNAGETIIEVLIATVVVAIGLTSTYYLINRDVSMGENQQEQAQAEKILESQIEDLRQGTSSPVCFLYKPNLATPSLSSVIAETGPDTTSAQGSNPCVLKTDGTQATASTVLAYAISITSSALGGNSPIYTITARWTNVFGDKAQDSVEYKTQ